MAMAHTDVPAAEGPGGAPAARRTWTALALLTLAGLLGNRFTIPLFFGADFVFGSVAVLLALAYYGPVRGLLVAAVVHAYTYLLWGHPFAWINFVSEALFVGLLLRRGRLGLLELDGLFWLGLGMPLAWYYHGVLLEMGSVTATFVMLKQAINGVFNALLVNMALVYLPLDRLFLGTAGERRLSFRASLFYPLVMMVLLPSLILTGVNITQEKTRLEREVLGELQTLSGHVRTSLLQWRAASMRAVQELAAQAAVSSSPGGLQAQTDLLQRSLEDFLSMHVEDARGRTAAFAPPVSEGGRSNLGLDFSQRPWFQAVQASGRPHVSEVFQAYMAVFTPVVNFSAPFFRQGRFAGAATGTLDLRRIDQMLRDFRSARMTRLTLCDQEGRVIASTAPERVTLTPWRLEASGVRQPLNGSVYLWRADDRPRPSMSRWRDSFYVQQTPLGPDLPWTLTVEAAVAPLQSLLYRAYVKNLTVMVVLTVLALLLSHLLSRRFSRPLAELAVQTANLPERLTRAGEVAWPRAATQEVASLIHNIRAMAGVLRVNFDKLRVQRDELRKTNRRLRREMKERLAAEETRLRLEERLRRAEKMEALGLLAGGVAHDLNNILGVLVGYSELLLEKTGEGGPLRRYGERILASGLKGAAIIQDLLTLARRGVTVSETVNLNGVLTEYLASPEFQALRERHPGVAFQAAPAAGLLNIKGSPLHLGKTVMNLVANAMEAIAETGSVTVRTENRHLDRPLQGYDDMPVGDFVVLSVSDTGGGIPAEDLGKIFEPFYTKKVMGRSGTGLGLAVVWGAVKDHGGYIDVQSREGEGSVFTLYFPVTREALPGAEASVSAASYQGRGEQLLVVDDVAEQRDLATSMLERLGYRVSAVASGEAALAWLREREAALVILDMIMDPGLDGLETYRQMLGVRPGQRAVIVSGFSETERVRQAQALGAGPYVRKPYVLETIGLAVRGELDRPATPPGGGSPG